jgi:arginine decarboxylase
VKVIAVRTGTEGAPRAPEDRTAGRRPAPGPGSSAPGPARGLTISVTAGLGAGPNPLAAFDAALLGAGIANFNLIRLSSVIPTGAVLDRAGDHRPAPAGGWGDRLYVVLADSRITDPALEAWAGIGWVQDEGSGDGLFVEHEGHSRAEVERQIEASLGALCAGRSRSFGPPQAEVVGTPYLGEPTCALVAAVYGSEPWRVDPVIDLR